MIAAPNAQTPAIIPHLHDSRGFTFTRVLQTCGFTIGQAPKKSEKNMVGKSRLITMAMGQVIIK